MTDDPALGGSLPFTDEKGSPAWSLHRLADLAAQQFPGHACFHLLTAFAYSGFWFPLRNCPASLSLISKEPVSNHPEMLYRIREPASGPREGL